MTRLDDKTALVTGGASGIGRAIALAFHAAGASVTAFDLDGAGLEETCSSAGGAIEPVRGDVTDTAAVRAAVERIVARHGRLDVLSHNAGVDQPVSDTLDITDETWSRVIAVNVGGTFTVDREAIRAMTAGGGGAILNTVSDLGYVVVPGLAAYCASKGAALQLTRALAAEYAPAIRVNALCPTMVDTPMGRRSMSTRSDAEAYLKEIESEIPMRRIARVDDLTGAALFLVSDEARYITGAALAIDGGRTIV